MVIAGHDLRFVPPGWCGAAMRVQTWLADGWFSEIIIAATSAAARRKRGTSANSVQFFERPLRRRLRQAAPLPRVAIRQPETLMVTANGDQESSFMPPTDPNCECTSAQHWLASMPRQGVMEGRIVSHNLTVD
ncbi:hypothetical protein [Nitrobacter vulgaris]|nr:hypothetical protein [Nitrobacter vulgaris]